MKKIGLLFVTMGLIIVLQAQVIPIFPTKHKTFKPQTKQSKKSLIEELIAIESEMVFVEGGDFMIGTQDNDADRHKISYNSFHIAKYEIIQAQWIAIMGNNPSETKGENLPVEKVSWNDVQVFIQKLNSLTGKVYRLPTEIEWEVAAKGGKLTHQFLYSGSDNINQVGWCWDGKSDIYITTHPVGKKKPNELGIYDMTGNVSEWCNDDNNNSGSNIHFHPVHGGDWGTESKMSYITFQNNETSDLRSSQIGFRLALAN